jgi:hypothetical protein
MNPEDEAIEAIGEAMWRVDRPHYHDETWEEWRETYLPMAKAAYAAAKPFVEKALITHTAQVASVVGSQANVGAMELAGQIVSILAANPGLIARFMREGSGMFVDGTLSDAGSGCLTFMSRIGRVTHPRELRGNMDH